MERPSRWAGPQVVFDVMTPPRDPIGTQLDGHWEPGAGHEPIQVDTRVGDAISPQFRISNKFLHVSRLR
jgi:hypothetical protein